MYIYIIIYTIIIKEENYSMYEKNMAATLKGTRVKGSRTTQSFLLSTFGYPHPLGFRGKLYFG